MSSLVLLALSFLLAVTLRAGADAQWMRDCGPNGFVCEGRSRVRLCVNGPGPLALGPAFLCPRGLQCDELSAGVCEDTSALVGPGLRGVHCRRGERVPDPQVGGCRGYVLCMPGGQRIAGIRFTCPGDTVFNALTRTCTVPAAYRCPSPAPAPASDPASPLLLQQTEPEGAERVGGRVLVDCKDYKLSAAHDRRTQVAYFCPSRPARAGAPLLCTVFSDQFCVILERDPQALAAGAGRNHRTPRRRARDTARTTRTARTARAAHTARAARTARTARTAHTSIPHSTHL